MNMNEHEFRCTHILGCSVRCPQRITSLLKTGKCPEDGALYSPIGEMLRC